MAHKTPTSQPVTFGPFMLDGPQRRLLKDGQPITVQPKTMDLLVLLVDKAGQLLERDMLMERLWPDVVVTEASLSRCVKEARRILGDDASQPRYIETVPKAGFRFIAAVGEPDSKSAPPALWLAGAGLLVVVTVLAFLTRQPEPHPVADSVAEPGLVVDVARINAERESRLGLEALGTRGADSRRKAIGHFEKALTFDPRHAPSLAGLAIALALHVSWYPDSEAERRINALVQQALSIDPELAHAYVAMGMLHNRYPHQYEQAETAFRKALELDPDYVEAYSGLATLMSNQGRVDESMRLLEKAVAIDPMHTTVTGNLAIALSRRGRYEEALQLVDALAQIPEAARAMEYSRSITLYFAGRWDELLLFQLESMERWPNSLNLATRLAEGLVRVGVVSVVDRMLDKMNITCEAVERKFRREAPLRVLRGGSALVWLEQQGEALDTFVNHDHARRWQGRLALLRSDYAGAIRAFEALFPEPESLGAWQGGLTDPAMDVQGLAYAYLALGRPQDAAAYLISVQSAIDHLREHGYQSAHNLTVLEARNASLMGDGQRTLQLLRRALEEGWLDVTEMNRPWGWEALIDNPGLSDLEKTISERAFRVRTLLNEETFESRLQKLMDAVPELTSEQCAELISLDVDARNVD